MSGFEKLNRGVPTAGEVAVTAVSDLPWSEVQRLVARAHAARSACIVGALRRFARSWGSVFHGPGHILPRDAGRQHVSAH